MSCLLPQIMTKSNNLQSCSSLDEAVCRISTCLKDAQRNLCHLILVYFNIHNIFRTSAISRIYWSKTSSFLWYLPMHFLTMTTLTSPYFDGRGTSWQNTKTQWYCSSKKNKDILFSLKYRHWGNIVPSKSTRSFIINQELVTKNVRHWWFSVCCALQQCN